MCKNHKKNYKKVKTIKKGILITSALTYLNIKSLVVCFLTKYIHVQIIMLFFHVWKDQIYFGDLIMVSL